MRIHFKNDWKSPTNILIKKLHDYGILMTFLKDFYQNSLPELDDLGILMKFLKDFDQNPCGQPQYQTIQMTIEFFKSQINSLGIMT